MLQPAAAYLSRRQEQKMLEGTPIPKEQNHTSCAQPDLITQGPDERQVLYSAVG